ncbi:hypothetical protein JTB14_000290 [Gonioctena quinquepunctata]|nr:hypothetical protein JTB14_000290 [Gonioctena quinquepunctata]
MIINPTGKYPANSSKQINEDKALEEYESFYSTINKMAAIPKVNLNEDISEDEQMDVEQIQTNITIHRDAEVRAPDSINQQAPPLIQEDRLKKLQEE